MYQDHTRFVAGHSFMSCAKLECSSKSAIALLFLHLVRFELLCCKFYANYAYSVKCWGTGVWIIYQHCFSICLKRLWLLFLQTCKICYLLLNSWLFIFGQVATYILCGLALGQSTYIFRPLSISYLASTASILNIVLLCISQRLWWDATYIVDCYSFYNIFYCI